MKILVIDVGGSHVKFKATGQLRGRSTLSGKGMTAADMVEAVGALVRDWDYEAVSLGFPGPVGRQGPRAEPANLGSGWVGFDFAAAFGCPVKVFNDAALERLGKEGLKRLGKQAWQSTLWLALASLRSYNRRLLYIPGAFPFRRVVLRDRRTWCPAASSTPALRAEGPGGAGTR